MKRCLGVALLAVIQMSPCFGLSISDRYPIPEIVIAVEDPGRFLFKAMENLYSAKWPVQRKAVIGPRHYVVEVVLEESHVVLVIHVTIDRGIISTSGTFLLGFGVRSDELEAAYGEIAIDLIQDSFGSPSR